MKRLIITALAALMCAAVFTGCGSKTYKDGTYTGRSGEFSDDEEGGSGYGVVELTISGGKITACTFNTYELDGTYKDEEYGKQNGEIANRDYYNKAQKANAARAVYAEELVSKGDAGSVDAVSGATKNYDQFQEAVADALAQAEE